MDSLEWNKIAGAVLGTLIFVLVIKFATEAIFEVDRSPPSPATSSKACRKKPPRPAAAAPVEEALPDWGTVLPTADVAAGQKISARCEQCHDLSKGGPNKIGPNLWGVVGRPRAYASGLLLFQRDDGRPRRRGPTTSCSSYLKSPRPSWCPARR